ncbi:MAG TPA: acyltransferase [Candidatus Acidoferrales bacterium]|nr:acyltransferase [Candidatus Acidoferrales bacterium]
MESIEKRTAGGSDPIQQDNPNLDYLRSMAVTMVVVFHLLLYFGPQFHRWDPEGLLGYAGVLFFFVHTSLVLMFSLNRLSNKFTGSKLFFGFMIRRAFRIYPLSILAVSAIAIFHLPFGGLSAFTFRPEIVSRLGLTSNLLLTQNLTNTHSVLGPLWSLPLEMQMYVFLPFLFLLSRRIRSAGPLILVWAGAVAVGYIHQRFGHMPDLAQYIPCFLPGVIAFKAGEKSKRIFPFFLWPILLFLVAGFLVLVPRMDACWAACLVIGLSIPRFKILSSAVLREGLHLVAKYSYGIYLGHYFCIWFAFVILHALPMEVQWLAFFSTIIALPMALFHLLEQPMINQGSRFVEALFGRSARATRTTGARTPAGARA